jgi:multiple sugar transport system permease protein
MSLALVHLLGAAAFWAGAALLAAAIASAVKWRAGEAEAHRRSGRSGALGMGLAAGLLLVAGASLPKRLLPSAVGDIHFPLAAPVMPLPAWFGAFALLLALLRIGESFTALTIRERWSRIVEASFLLGGSAVLVCAGFWTGRPFEVVSGTLPLSWGALAGLGALLAVGFFAAVGLERSAKGRGRAGIALAHFGLIGGSLIFSIPFAWLVLTSLKEERDMSNVDGMVWLPRVERQHAWDDPDRPFRLARLRGREVRATVIGLGRQPDTLLLQVERPFILAGRIFEAPRAETRPILRNVPVLKGEWNGQSVVGFAAKELDGGGRRVEILEPASLKGRRVDFAPEEVEPVMDSGARWANYSEVFEWLPEEVHYGLTFLWNTIVIVILSVAGSLASCSIVAYAFSRLRFPGRDALFKLMLATMMLPGAVTLLPTFLIFRQLGMVDTLQPIWLPTFFAGAFNVFLLRQFFRTIPMELEDAAKIDGCSYLRSFWQVMLPQVKPALAAIAIWTFMGSWNNFMGPLIYISSPENVPIAYALQLFQGEKGGSFGIMMAASAMATIPVVLLFFVAQKWFIEGVQLSGLGGR